MWEISVILVFCICLATCQQNVDTLVNEIFVRDNNGSSLRNQAENLDTYSSGSGLDLVRTESNDQYEDVTNQDEYAYGYGYDSTSEQVQTYQTTPIHVEPSNYPSSNQPALNEPNPCEVGECVPFHLCKNGSIITDGEGVLNLRSSFSDEYPDPKKHPCKGTFETCCSLRSETSLIISEPRAVNVGCGFRNQEGVGFRITGTDNEAQFGEFPWTVAIFKKENQQDGQCLNIFICGGSIIEPGVILTAAHCVDSKDPQSLEIRAGEWDTQTNDEVLPHQDRQVREYIIHPEYNKRNMHNDIALLFLEKPVDIAENVNTVCLPSPDDVFDGKSCIASGWGKDLFGKEGKYQVILKKIELPIVPREPCVQKLRTTRLGRFFELSPTFICAGGEQGVDTCKGDGGSPLVCPVGNKRYVQGGIVSWGIGCGENNTPGAYVNVPLFRPWIDEQLNLKQYSTSAYNLQILD